MKKNPFMLSLIGIAVVLVCVGLMFIPGFALLNGGIKTIPQTYLNGYEVIFHYVVKSTYFVDNAKGRASAGGIIALVFLALGLASLGLSKKSSVLSLLGGVLVALGGIMILLMPLWFMIIYDNGKVQAGWLAYVIGGVLTVVGGLLVYVGVMRLREEKNQLSKPKSQQYSYIRK
ncbi:MAG: hypothetical protein K6E11_01025 [Bacilli bacterium]|nr:hypothetical protein [Bacilli bacterium]